MNGMTIISLTAENVSAAHNVEKSSLDAPWSESELASLIGDDDKYYFTAIFDGSVVGIAGFYRVLDGCYRRRGIADELLFHLLDTAQNNGCTFATLETAADNTAAIALYKKHGFTQNGRRKGYYHGTDALLFRKEL